MDKSCACNRARCFAHHGGLCGALSDNHFRKLSCPFFKTQEELIREKQKCAERLVRLGIIGSVEEYENGNFVRARDAFERQKAVMNGRSVA